MTFSVILLLLILAVTYFHYLQGFFSATVSAVCATVAVLVAMTYFEPIVTKISPGRFADSAHGMVLLCLFALTYVLLRLAYDKLIPGNIRLPSTIEKIGGALMGFIAAVMATGLVAVAAQALPFGPSIGGYARYRVLPERDVMVNESAVQKADRKAYEELAGYTIGATDEHEATHQSLNLLPVDDWMINFVYHCSDGGSTAGSQGLSRIHPDYLQELFGNRIGIQLGAKRSAQPVDNEEVVAIQRVYTLDSIPQMDGQVADIRKRDEENQLPKVLKPEAGKALLVVRVQYKLNATDTDKFTRVSTGSVRLVASTTDDAGRVTYHNYFPVGTVENGTDLLVYKPDDPLFVTSDKAADFLFVVPASAMPDMKVVPVMFDDSSDVFIETKRFARIPLAGMKMEKPEAFDQLGVALKGEIRDKLSQIHPTPDMVKAKLVGTWKTTVAGNAAVFGYKPDGTFVETITTPEKQLQATGKWEVISATAEALVFDRKLDVPGPVARKRVVFKGTTEATMTDLTTPSRAPLSLKK